jgi:hypothetical protein
VVVAKEKGDDAAADVAVGWAPLAGAKEKTFAVGAGEGAAVVALAAVLAGTDAPIPEKMFFGAVVAGADDPDVGCVGVGCAKLKGDFEASVEAGFVNRFCPSVGLDVDPKPTC